MLKKIHVLFFLLIFFAANAQRNIVLIIADDLGSPYCGFQENHLDTAAMPNVRKLIRKGVRFSNAWATPYCSPTRAGILTGRYSFRTGVGTVISDATSTPLDTSENTIPKLLKNSQAPNKYVCANIGKWHLQSFSPKAASYPNIMGYDHFSGIFSGAVQNYNSWNKTVNGVTSNSTSYVTTELTTDAINWLGQQKTKPFFLWLAFNAPHDPYHLPPDSLHTYHNLSGTAADIAADPKPYFKAMIESMDNQIGKLYNWLETNNKLDNTDIIFIGDNGDSPKVAQIGRAKGNIYQAGLSVPFIIAGPDVKNPNRTSDALVNVHDLFATILELAGFADWQKQISTNKPVDSKSLVPILTNQATQVRSWTFAEVFSPTPKSTEGKAIRNMDYKLLHFESGKQEFYYLKNDPNEQVNLLNRTLTTTEQSNYKSLCAEMGALLNKDICNVSVKTKEFLSLSKPSVAPNPAQQTLMVSFMDKQLFSYKIYSIDGKMLKKGQSYHEINTTDLQNGIYLLHLEQGGEHFVEKIVIQR